MIKIIKADKKNAPAVSAVSQECFSVPMSVNQAEEILKSELTRAFVAVKGESIVGFAIMQNVCGECFVDNIAVLKAHRRQGTGRMLTEALIAQSESEKAYSISLEVRESNLAAINMYSSLGFKTLGVRRNFYSMPTENGLIMTKENDQ